MRTPLLVALGLSTCLTSVACDDGGSSGSAPSSPTADAGPLADGQPLDPFGVMLSFTEPLDGAIVTTRALTVRGTYTGSPRGITVNGVAARLMNGRFDATLTLEDGPNTLTAIAGEASASVNVTVDATAPELVIEAPGRGHWQSDPAMTLRFSAEDATGLSRVTLNDLDIPPGRGPSFTELLTLPDGLNLLRVEATDASGNVTRESVAALIGPTRDADATLNGAFRLRIGQNGLAGLGRRAAQTFDALNLTQLLPQDPIAALGFMVELVSAEHARTTLVELVPEGDHIAVHFRIERAVFDVTLEISGNRYPISLRALAIDARASLAPSIVGEARTLSTGLSDLQVNLEGFSVDLAAVPPFGGNQAEEESGLEAAVELAASDFARSYVPRILDDALASFSRSVDITTLGAQLRLEVVPEAVAVSRGGLVVRAGARLTLTGPASIDAPVVPGYVGRPTTWDDVPETDNLALAVDDDFFNLFMYQFWRSTGGLPVIDRRFFAARPEAANFALGFLGNLVRTAWPDLPTTTPLRLEPTLPLPPVMHVVPAQGAGAGVQLGLGDLAVRVATDDRQQRPLLDGASSLLYTGDIQLVPGPIGTSPTLRVALTSTTSTFDVTTPELKGEVEASVEAPVVSLLGALSELLPRLLTEVPLPGVDAVPVESFTMSVTGPDQDFLNIEARIAP